MTCKSSPFRHSMYRSPTGGAFHFPKGISHLHITEQTPVGAGQKGAVALMILAFWKPKAVSSNS